MRPTGQRWNALPEAEKAKYNTGPTGLAASGQGEGGTWVLPAPTIKPFGLGADLGAAPAVPPAPSVAPTIPSSSWLEQQQLGKESSDSAWKAFGVSQ
jgi:hypothetical protein